MLTGFVMFVGEGVMPSAAAVLALARGCQYMALAGSFAILRDLTAAAHARSVPGSVDRAHYMVGDSGSVPVFLGIPPVSRSRAAGGPGEVRSRLDGGDCPRAG